MNAAELLQSAREIVEAGWCQGDFEDENGNHCALGAIGRANQLDGHDSYEAYMSAKYYLEGSLPPGARRVAQYNDHPDTTKADILALFDRAIEKAS